VREHDAAVLVLELLREPKVGQLEVAVHADHHVLGLEVPEDDVVAVHVLERERDLGRVHDDPLLGQPAVGLEQLVQVATAHQVHHEEDVV
jgi:hypothetical protein